MIRKTISQWKDDAYTYIDGIEAGVNDIVRQCPEEAGKLAACCWVCGRTDCLEAHHVAGRKHDPRTVTVCARCHRTLSQWQKVWDKHWEQPGQPEEVKYAFFLLGLRDLLRLKAEVTGNVNYRLLADLYIDEISTILGGNRP